MDFIEELKSIIEIYLNENNYDYLTNHEFNDLINYSHLNIEEYFEMKIDRKLIKDNIKKLFDKYYYYNGQQFINQIDQTEYDKLEQHYLYLLNLPQPEQKSKEWFDMRNNMITASSAAQAMGESKYDTMDQFIYEKVFGREFSENKFVHHGKKYEHIATMFYQHVYNVKIGEFGLLKHPEIDFIGASPDGICSAYTLDGIRGSPLLGTMVEIKCPMTREIKTSGDIKDGICPYYYWVQVQLQLQCCNLNRCDFIQLSIKEYETDEETTAQDKFMNDNHLLDHTENQNNMVKINQNFGRGALIQLLPIKFTQKVQYEKREWYSKYIYPPSLDMTKGDVLNWIDDEKKKFKLNPLSKDYKFDKPLFFRIVTTHNTIILREDKWFEEAVPKLKVTWDKIKFLRENKTEALKFKEAIDSKKKTKLVFIPSATKKNDGFLDSED
uniref:YqaJ viral recombinase domain-containing protein n=1 Tax=viral metagenome TaxID=1070528 RepID=A0A6C0H125_9ZZZZ